MSEKKANEIESTIVNPAEDGIDRRGMLKCMAWAGAGLLWTLEGGIPSSSLLAAPSKKGAANANFGFVQISDSHIGFNKPANPDVTSTMQAAIDKINGLPQQPDFIIHTGDLTHQSRPKEFDDMHGVLQSSKVKNVFFVPGEHDTSVDDGKLYLEKYGKDTKGSGWYSFDHKGVHLVGLVNVVKLEGMGQLGAEQLDWLKKDLKSVSSSTPIVLFAHIPLWTVYPEWGWGTKDSAEALSYTRNFGSVTVLNGHIHQIMQKVEGKVSFHSARSTAFPQPAPGKAPSPGPLAVPAGELRSVLGVTEVSYNRGTHHLAVVDETLAGQG
jgi:3',5'-cyclic AMP phosphodiesterase CpdA